MSLSHPRVSLLPPSRRSPHHVDRTVDPEPEPSLLLGAAMLRPRNVAVTGLVVLLAIACAALGSTALAACVGLLAPALYAGMVTRSLGEETLVRQVHGPLGPPLRAPVALAAIQPPELRTSYQRVLHGHERLRRALSAAPVAAASLDEAYRRCGDLVEAAGQLAAGSSPIHAQLERWSTQGLLDQSDDLSARSGWTQDGAAARTFRRAAGVREHQLATTRQLEDYLDRVAARLALAEAVIDSVTATAVKMDALEREERLEEAERAAP